MRNILLFAPAIFSISVFSLSNSSAQFSSFTGKVKFTTSADDETFVVSKYDFKGSIVFIYNNKDSNSTQNPKQLFENNTEFLFIKKDSSLYFGAGKLEPTGEKWCTVKDSQSVSIVEYIYAPKGMKGNEILYHFSPEFGLLNIYDGMGSVYCIFIVDKLAELPASVLYRCGKRSKKYSKLK